MNADIQVGQRVCVVGRGADRPVHRHVKVDRITKTMVITDDGRRYRREALHPSIPYSPYGGTHLDVTCQRP